MARTKRSAHTITASVEDLMTAVGGLATSVKGAIANSREVKAAAVDAKDVAKSKGRRLKRALKSTWSEIRGASKRPAGRRPAAEGR